MLLFRCSLAQSGFDIPAKRSRKTRKDPRAPKRSKSAYIFFAIDQRERVKGILGGGARVGDIAKKTSELWKALSDEEREKWEGIAKADRDRYQVEKASYTGPLLIPGDSAYGKKGKKDPSAPKRPLTAFLYFSQQMRPTLKVKNPEWRIAELSQELGRMWRNMSEEERMPYAKHEEEERKKYQVVNEKWKREQEELAKKRAAEEEEERKRLRDQQKKLLKQQAKLEKQRQLEEDQRERQAKLQRQFQQDHAFSMHDLYRQQAAAQSGRDDAYMGMSQYTGASALAGMLSQDQGMMGYPGGMGGSSAAAFQAQQQALYGDSVAGRYAGLGGGAAGMGGMGQDMDPSGMQGLGASSIAGMGGYGAAMGMGMGGIGGMGGAMPGMGMYGKHDAKLWNLGVNW